MSHETLLVKRLSSVPRGAQSAQRMVYFDCSSGAGGDMLLAALLDLGEAQAVVRELMRAVHLPAGTLRLRRMPVNALSGLQCRLRSSLPRHRSLSPLIARLRRSRLPPAVRQRAQQMLERLARAEHRVHRGTAHAHRVHEIGRMDTLISVAGCALALERLGVTRVFVGPLPLGYGWTRSEEGLLPNPGPAVLELLRGFPVLMTQLPHELVTPTAAAILSVVAQPVPPDAPFTVERIGYGVGTQRIAGVPGMVRSCLGRAGQPSSRTT